MRRRSALLSQHVLNRAQCRFLHEEPEKIWLSRYKKKQVEHKRGLLLDVFVRNKGIWTRTSTAEQKDTGKM